MFEPFSSCAAVATGPWAVLELHRVECVRGGRVLFSDLELTLPPGHLLRVQGANGAGKTSLLRMITGLLSPARGELRWQGQPIARLREDYGRQLIYVGHAAALKDDLTARENLRVASALGGQPASEAEAAAALKGAGLGGRDRVPSRLLSQGQRRRVALARLALAGSAPLWVLDEPFNALDTVATQWLLGLVGAQLDRGGMVVLTSHQSVALLEGWLRVELAL
jgi:heme exporter protein A